MMEAQTNNNDDAPYDKNGNRLEVGDWVRDRYNFILRINGCEDAWGLNQWTLMLQHPQKLHVIICRDADGVEKLSDEEAMLWTLEQ